MLPHSLWGMCASGDVLAALEPTSLLQAPWTNVPQGPNAHTCTLHCTAHPPTYHHHPGNRAPPNPQASRHACPLKNRWQAWGPEGARQPLRRGCAAAGWPPCQLGPDQGVLRPVGPKLHMGAPGCGCLQHICMSTVALQRRSARQSPVLVCCGIICCWGVASARAHYFRLFCIHSPKARPLSAQGHTTLTAMPPAG
jgi:hypothetical protein